ncbi:hypothetical protein SBRCBS47491_005190 [Sporothrix bragantina]|uniref:N-acetyltransferase domain-containing protein n=1 Tax=Sporothrix bragantina TaxID=671064 RepID=A0ABP0BWD9_9PEZI
MAASDAMIDPAIADSGVSYSPHHNHEHDVVNVDGKDDGASVASDTEEIFAPNPAASYAASAAAYAASAAATAVAATQSASPAPAPAPTAQMAMAQAHVPSPSPGPPPAQTPASPVSTASAAAAAAAAAAAVAAAAATPMARVQQYNPVAHGHLVLYLAALHGSRITADNLAGSFAPPLNHEKLLDWWRVRLTTSAVFLLLRTPYESSTAPGGAGAGGAAAAAKKVQGTDLVGVIMLRSHPAETSPHVATVDLLLVNLQYRQLGGERQLLQTVERQALREGRTLLTAEAESKSSMANMYTTLGFTEAGQIPGMVLRPATGEKRSLSIFYKDLEQAAAAQAAAQSVASSSRQSPVAQS